MLSHRTILITCATSLSMTRRYIAGVIDQSLTTLTILKGIALVAYNATTAKMCRVTGTHSSADTSAELPAS